MQETSPIGPASKPPAGRIPLRSATDSYLGGVAGGIAQSLQVDPFMLRSGLLGATLFMAYAINWVPIVPFAYTVFWLVLPGPNGRSAVRSLARRSGQRDLVAAVSSFIVVALLLSRPIFGIALALAALAWVLLSHDDDSAGARAPVATPTDVTAPSGDAASSDPTSAARTLNDRVAADDMVDVDMGAPVAPGSARSVRASWGRARRSERGEALVTSFRRRIERRPLRNPALWPLTLSLLVILTVGGFMVDATLDGGLDPALVVNLMLITIGAVIVISAWRGRALWTAAIALLLLPAWVGFSVADIGRFEGSGAVIHRPTALPESGELVYENGYGPMTIDLRNLALEPDQDLPLRIGTTAGSVTVLAPFDADVVLRSQIGFGTSEIHGHGLGFFEKDREPYLDRTTTRRYNAHGAGCWSGYWSTWRHLVATHSRFGIDFDSLLAAEEDDVDAILQVITDAGFEEPVPIDQGLGGRPGVAYTMTDEHGNQVLTPRDLSFPGGPTPFPRELSVPLEPAPVPLEPASVPLEPAPIPEAFVPATEHRTWSYSAGRDGEPCNPQPPPLDPATIKIDATIGVGTLYIDRDEF